MDDDCTYEEMPSDNPLLGTRPVILPRRALGWPIPKVLTVTFRVPEISEVRVPSERY